MTAADSPGGRCAVHPVRPAVDACPVCGRPRCSADAAAAPGGGCLACGARPGDAPVVRPPDRLERLVRAALASTAVALPGGVVAAQYVGAQLFAYLTPFVLGVLTAAAAQAAAGAGRTGGSTGPVRLVAAGYAVLGVALGFVLEQSEDVLDPRTLLPYAAAVAGVVLWTLPPRAPRAPERPDTPER